MNKKERERIKAQFEKLYVGYRLLAIQLNGFSHLVYYDEGKKQSAIHIDDYSAYAPELHYSDRAKKLLGQFPHYLYQNNAQETVWVKPNER